MTQLIIWNNCDELDQVDEVSRFLLGPPRMPPHSYIPLNDYFLYIYITSNKYNLIKHFFVIQLWLSNFEESLLWTPKNRSRLLQNVYEKSVVKFVKVVCWVFYNLYVSNHFLHNDRNSSLERLVSKNVFAR